MPVCESPIEFQCIDIRKQRRHRLALAVKRR